MALFDRVVTIEPQHACEFCKVVWWSSRKLGYLIHLGLLNNDCCKNCGAVRGLHEFHRHPHPNVASGCSAFEEGGGRQKSGTSSNSGDSEVFPYIYAVLAGLGLAALAFSSLYGQLAP